MTGTSGIVGTWHRAQTCEEMRNAFERAGLAESHREWLQGNFFAGEAGPSSGDPCAGSEGPLEHSHFFTGSGEFGSGDENGAQVDEGDYRLVDADTLAFPSHATEFGYQGRLEVDYTLDGQVLTFDVDLPDECPDACADAYAWAVSAFASGPWERADIP